MYSDLRIIDFWGKIGENSDTRYILDATTDLYAFKIYPVRSGSLTDIVLHIGSQAAADFSLRFYSALSSGFPDYQASGLLAPSQTVTPSGTYTAQQISLTTPISVSAGNGIWLVVNTVEAGATYLLGITRDRYNSDTYLSDPATLLSINEGASWNDVGTCRVGLKIGGKWGGGAKGSEAPITNVGCSPGINPATHVEGGIKFFSPINQYCWGIYAGIQVPASTGTFKFVLYDDQDNVVAQTGLFDAIYDYGNTNSSALAEIFTTAPVALSPQKYYYLVWQKTTANRQYFYSLSWPSGDEFKGEEVRPHGPYDAIYAGRTTAGSGAWAENDLLEPMISPILSTNTTPPTFPEGFTTGVPSIVWG